MTSWGHDPDDHDERDDSNDLMTTLMTHMTLTTLMTLMTTLGSLGDNSASLWNHSFFSFFSNNVLGIQVLDDPPLTIFRASVNKNQLWPWWLPVHPRWRGLRPAIGMPATLLHHPCINIVTLLTIISIKTRSDRSLALKMQDSTCTLGYISDQSPHESTLWCKKLSGCWNQFSSTGFGCSVCQLASDYVLNSEDLLQIYGEEMCSTCVGLILTLISTQRHAPTALRGPSQGSSLRKENMKI